MDPSGATSAARFLPSSSEVAPTLGFGSLRHVTTTGSTNVDLAEEARRGDTTASVLVTDHQTAGRGRLDRTWDDAAGDALLVSLRLPVPREEAAAAVRALGAAARAAADNACADRVLVKWPNDLVVVEGATPGKLAGVLGEFVDGDEPCVVIGLGVNLRPVPAQPGATSIVECGGGGDRDEVLTAVLREFARRRRDGSGVVDELRTFSATIGSRVRVELPGGAELFGEALDLTDDGELVVRDDEERDRTVSAGDVVHLRSV